MRLNNQVRIKEGASVKPGLRCPLLQPRCVPIWTPGPSGTTTVATPGSTALNRDKLAISEVTPDVLIFLNYLDAPVWLRCKPGDAGSTTKTVFKPSFYNKNPFTVRL